MAVFPILDDEQYASNIDGNANDIAKYNDG